MWLELSLASGAVAFLCGSILAVNKAFPAEVERFLRIIKADFMARVPITPKRPSVEVALHANVDVDMEWWDDEYAKLIQSSVPDLASSSWGRFVDRQIATAAELQREQGRRMVSITHGDLTYSMSHLHGGESIIKLKREMEQFVQERERECQDCEYVEMRTYADKYAVKHKISECWECRKMGVRGPDGTTGPIAASMHAPSAQDKWSIS